MPDDNQKLLPYLNEARKRGVIFDVGHGGGSLLFRQTVPAIQQGWIPDSMSTDLHVGGMNAGMKDMLNVMSKFLNMGSRCSLSSRNRRGIPRVKSGRKTLGIFRWARRPRSPS